MHRTTKSPQNDDCAELTSDQNPGSHDLLRKGHVELHGKGRPRRETRDGDEVLVDKIGLWKRVSGRGLFRCVCPHIFPYLASVQLRPLARS